MVGGFLTRVARWRGSAELAVSAVVVEIGRAGLVDFVSFLVGWGAVGSLYFDLPKKSLLKNPGFRVFC